jgi:hypothetical protein
MVAYTGGINESPVYGSLYMMPTANHKKSTASHKREAKFCLERL